jgi:hypothetical protein
MTERSVPARVGDWARAHPRLLAAAVIVIALTLAGTAVVIASTLLSGLLGVAQGDATPSPTASAAQSPPPSPEPTNSPDPSESVAPTPVPGPPWPPVGDPSVEGLLPPMWTVAVVNELNVRSGPGTEHPAIGRLDAGDLALVVDVVDFEWVQVAVDGAIGFVNAGPRGDRYLQATKTPWVSSFTGLIGVASDGETYIAYGAQFEADYPPYELHGVPSLMLGSEDGVNWTDVDSGIGFSIKAVAGSAEGWVAIGSIPLGGSLMSFSPDGRTWDEPGVVGDGNQHAVAHGPAGWLAIGGDMAWVSADGRSWDGPSTIGLGDAGTNFELESSDAGYVMFDRHTIQLMATVDGIDWTSIDHGGARVSDAELVGDRLLTVLVDAEGATTVRRGMLGADGAVTWSGPAAAVDASWFHVDRITQNPDGLLAIGWDEVELVPALWRSTDGAAWQRIDAGADALTGVGLFEPVWGSVGWVGPGLTRSADGAHWLASDYTLAYEGPVPPCPPAEKASLIVLAYLGRYAEGCFGNASVTIRGYVPLADGFGGCCPPQGEPDWLAGAFPGSILAAGVTSEEFAPYQFSVRVPPGVDRAPLDFSGAGRWVEVVGHYNDPASASCVSRPQRNFPNPLASHEAMQAMCRERFVVESVIEVEGP